MSMASSTRGRPCEPGVWAGDLPKLSMTSGRTVNKPRWDTKRFCNLTHSDVSLVLVKVHGTARISKSSGKVMAKVCLGGSDKRRTR